MAGLHLLVQSGNCGYSSMKMPQFTLRRLLLIVSVLGVGLAVMIQGARLELRNPRSNAEDDFAWRVWAAGMSLIGIVIGLVFHRPKLTASLAILFPALGFMLMVTVLWVCIIGHFVWQTVFG